MSKSKSYSRVYNRSIREWDHAEISSLTIVQWAEWIKDRLHQSDDLPGPVIRIDEAWEDIFFMLIPQLKNKSIAIEGLTLAYRDAINDINGRWRVDAVGALILLIRIIIVQENNDQQTETIRDITEELLEKLTKPLLDNRARDPYTQATYLMNDIGKQQKEQSSTNRSAKIYVDAWHPSPTESHS